LRFAVKNSFLCIRRFLHFELPKTLSDFAGRGYLIGEMQPKSDAQLLREFAEHGIESAFTEIVTRHTNLVYSAAVRQMDSSDRAAEITQSVFIVWREGRGTCRSGWPTTHRWRAGCVAAPETSR